jgi:hypothetical protein
MDGCIFISLNRGQQMEDIQKDELQVFAEWYLQNAGPLAAVPFEGAVDRIENVTSVLM